MLMVFGGEVKGQRRCSSATSQFPGTYGVCVGCGVSNPNNAINTTSTNPSNLYAAVALGGVYQQLIFPNPGSSTDSIRVDLGVPTGISALGSITVRVLNGTTLVNSRPLDNAAIHIQVLGTTRFYAMIPAGGSYDRIEIRFGAVLGLLSNLDLYGADIVYPNPTVSGQTICAGNPTTLTAVANGGATLKWYATPTGGSALTTGLTYTTPILTTTTTYYIEILNGTCANPQRYPVTVTVNPLPTLSAIPNQTLCAGQSIDLSILNPTSNVTGGTYVWSATPGGTALINTAVIPSIGSNEYWVRYSSNNCYSDQNATILVNPLPEFTITASTSVVPIGTNNVTLTTTPVTATINWYNQDGTSLGSGATKNVGPFATAGTYTFNAIADNGPGTCSTSESITITVYDPNACPPLTERVYADSQTWSSIVTGGVFNPDQAVNGDVKTSSTLNTGLGLLGLGTVWQNLLWSQPVEAGTPVTIKLGPATSALALASGISVIAFKKNSTGTMIDIGTMQSVDGSLLSLLSGENAFEFTFVPSDATGVKEYDGVRVQLGAVLSLVQSVNLFHAYHSRPATSSLDCSKGDVLDILYGAVPLVAGIGALSATVNVSNPWNAVDKNESTFATLSSGVAVLAYAKEQIIFSSPSLPSDSLKIITSRPSGLLTLDLLTGFSIQRYLGTSPVGSPITSSSTFLNIKLLDGGTQAAILLLPTGEPYDRVEIRLGGAVNLLSSINVHEVQRIANTKLPAATDNDNNITVCKGDDITLPTPPNSCTSFKWYDALTGGNEIPGSTINTSSFDGPKKFYIQPIRYGCELMPRGVLNVTIKQPAISLGSSPTVCQGLSSVTLPYSALSCATKYNISWDPNATAAGFLPVSNGVFTGGTIPIPVPTGSLAIPGTYTGFLNISNSPSVSVTYSFTVTILPKPPKPSVHLITNSQY